MLEFLDHWVFTLIDLALTTYLVYYYITNEYKKDKENK